MGDCCRRRRRRRVHVLLTTLVTFYCTIHYCHGFALHPWYQVPFMSTTKYCYHQKSHSWLSVLGTPSSLSDAAITSADDDEQLMMQDIPFDDIFWDAYTLAIEQMMTRPGVIKKTKEHEVENCRKYLFARQGLPPFSVASRQQQSTAKQLAAEEQAALFENHYNFTKQEHEFITRCLVYVGDFCAKPRHQHEEGFDRRAPIVVSWHKLKEMGWFPRENSFSTYMYILSAAMEEDNNYDNTSEDHSQSSVYDDALLEIVNCHGRLYGSNEKTVAIQLKHFIRRGDVEAAEELLTRLEAEVQQEKQQHHQAGTESQDLGLRLRTFLPLMEHYCEIGDGDAILRLYDRMQAAPGTHLDADAYALILASLARNGYFFQAGLTEQGTIYGPKLFDSIASTMADDVLELTPQVAATLEVGFSDSIKEGENTTVVKHVTIPPNCTCPTTGAKLRLLKLNDNQRQHVHDTLLEMAHLSSQEFMQKVNRRKPKVATSSEDPSANNHAYEAICNFSEWLE
jgi:hypothetical protein